MTVGFSLFLASGAALLFLRLYGTGREQKFSAADFFGRVKERLSVTDFCVLAYLVFSTISVVSGGFYKDALWGSFGWNMGWMSQLSFVLIYLAVSRFGRHYRSILIIFGGSALFVFLIGILHRMLIDPIGFYEGLQGYQMAQFLSTMGQATWYASYLVVALPVGVAVFLFSEKSLWRGLYSGGVCLSGDAEQRQCVFCAGGFYAGFLLGLCEKTGDAESLCGGMHTLFCGG